MEQLISDKADRSGRPAASTDTVKSQWSSMLEYHQWLRGTATGAHPVVPCDENEKPATPRQIKALASKLCTKEFELPLIAKLRLIVNHLLESGDPQFQTLSSVLEYYEKACTRQDVQSKLASLKVSISLISDNDFNVSPRSDQVLVGFGALLSKRYEIDPANCIPPEDIGRLLVEYKGEEALEKFLNRLSNVQQDHPFDTGRALVTREFDARHQLCNDVEQALVSGSHMLINVHGANWDALTAFSETILREFWKTNKSNLPVIYLPLRSCLRVNNLGEVQAESKALSLEMLMGHLFAYVMYGDKYDAARGVKKISHADFDLTLNKIREKIKTAPCIFIIDGLYIQANAGSERQRIERQIRDDHWLYIISRLLEPVLSMDEVPTGLDQFAQNRILITSNQAVSLSNYQSDLHSLPEIMNQPLTSSMPLVEKTGLQYKLDRDNRVLNRYWGSLQDSMDHALRVENVFASRAGQYIDRNDTVHSLLSAIFTVADALNNDSNSSSAITDESIHALLEDYATAAKPESSIKITCQTLIHIFDHASSELGALWRELFLLISITPEGIRYETVERIVRRMQYVFPENARRLPSLSYAGLNGSLFNHVNDFALSMRSILGFIREEYVEGTESGDHREEYWVNSVLADWSEDEYVTLDDVQYRSLSALDFRYPEIRETLLDLIDKNEVEFGAEVVHRLLCEITVQHQVIQLRHGEVKESANIRQWHNSINAIYHGLMSLRFDLNDSSGLEQMVLIEQEFGTRDLDCRGSNRDFWRFVYYMIYCDLLDGRGAYRLSKVHGLADLKIALLRVLENPWLLTWTRKEKEKQKGVWGHISRQSKRLTNDASGDGKLRHQYGYDMVLSHLSRSEADTAHHYLFEYLITEPELTEIIKFDSLDRQIIQYVNISEEMDLQRLKTLNLLLRLLNQKIEYLDIDELIVNIAEKLVCVSSIVELADKFRINLEKVLSNSKCDLPDVFEDWNIDSDIEIAIVDLVSVKEGSKELQELTRLFTRIVDVLSNYADYMELPGPHSSKDKTYSTDNPDEWNEKVWAVVKRLAGKGHSPDKLRLNAFGLTLAIERIRAMVNRTRPDELISTQFTSLSYCSISLALQLNSIYKNQNAITDTLQRTPFEKFARRVCDMQLRIGWQLPMNKAHCFIMEANLLKDAASDEIKKIARINKDVEKAMKVSRAFDIQQILQVKEDYFKRAVNLLSLARNMIGRAEKLLVQSNANSQPRLKLAFIRTQLHHDIAYLHTLHGSEQNEDLVRICQQLSAADIAFLSRVGNFRNRGYARVRAYSQSLEI